MYPFNSRMVGHVWYGQCTWHLIDSWMCLKPFSAHTLTHIVVTLHMKNVGKSAAHQLQLDRFVCNGWPNQWKFDIEFVANYFVFHTPFVAFIFIFLLIFCISIVGATELSFLNRNSVVHFSWNDVFWLNLFFLNFVVVFVDFTWKISTIYSRDAANFHRMTRCNFFLSMK